MLRDATSLDLELLETSIPPVAGSTLLLSGSFAAGLAHRRSDVDVHVVGGEPPDVELMLSGARVQFTRVPDGAADIARSLAGGALERAGWSQAYFLSDRERWELFRLATAMPIRQDPAHDWLGSSGLRQAVRRIQIGTAAHQIARAADDIRGMVESAEPDSARDLMRQVLRDAASLTLAALGDLYASEKLILPRLRRSWLGRSEVSWLVTAYAEGDGDLRRLPELQGLTALVQLVAWDEPITPELLALLHGGPARRWVRSPEFWVVRRPDAVTLADSGGHGFRLPRELALLWVLSESGDLDAIESALLSAGVPLPRASIESGIGKLVELRLIESERR